MTQTQVGRRLKRRRRAGGVLAGCVAIASLLAVLAIRLDHPVVAPDFRSLAFSWGWWLGTPLALTAAAVLIPALRWQLPPAVRWPLSVALAGAAGYALSIDLTGGPLFPSGGTGIAERALLLVAAAGMASLASHLWASPVSRDY
ncbi:hypothetical protein [Streptacidiphilus sp. PAMC 29251]